MGVSVSNLILLQMVLSPLEWICAQGHSGLRSPFYSSAHSQSYLLHRGKMTFYHKPYAHMYFFIYVSSYVFLFLTLTDCSPGQICVRVQDVAS